MRVHRAIHRRGVRGRAMMNSRARRTGRYGRIRCRSMLGPTKVHQRVSCVGQLLQIVNQFGHLDAIRVDGVGKRRPLVLPRSWLGKPSHQVSPVAVHTVSMPPMLRGLTSKRGRPVKAQAAATIFECGRLIVPRLFSNSSNASFPVSPNASWGTSGNWRDEEKQC